MGISYIDGYGQCSIDLRADCFHRTAGCLLVCTLGCLPHPDWCFLDMWGEQAQRYALFFLRRKTDISASTYSVPAVETMAFCIVFSGGVPSLAMWTDRPGLRRIRQFVFTGDCRGRTGATLSACAFGTRDTPFAIGQGPPYTIYTVCQGACFPRPQSRDKKTSGLGLFGTVIACTRPLRK